MLMKSSVMTVGVIIIAAFAGCLDNTSSPTIEEDVEFTGCSTSAADPMPVPTGLSNPVNGTFDQTFTLSWDHVWTGCGGYEVGYRRAATSTWVTIDVVSGSSADITIELPSGSVNDPTSYEIRVRSYWGSGSDTREYSDYSASGNIEMHKE